jgi:hypothetical protein
VRAWGEGSGGEGTPALGRRGRLWFRHRVRALFLPMFEADAQDAALTSRIVDWYTERAERYAVWVTAETYLGPRFAWGHWTVLESEVRADLEVARYQCGREVAQARDTDRFPTLEAWLTAEARGELEAGSIEEPPARHLVEPAALNRYVAVRARILKSRPRECTECGAEFQPKSTTARRCATCCESEAGRGANARRRGRTRG